MVHQNLTFALQLPDLKQCVIFLFHQPMSVVKMPPIRPPSRDTHDSFSLATRVRDLELLTSFIQERLDRQSHTDSPHRIVAIPTQDQKENNLMRSLQLKQSFIQQTIRTLKDNFQNNQEITTATFLDFQKRIEALQFSNSSLKVAVEGVSVREPISLPLVESRPDRFSYDMKDIIEQEKAYRDQMSNELLKKIQEVSQKVALQDNSIHTTMRRQKQELMEELRQWQQQHRNLEVARASRSEQEKELVNRTLGMLQQKVQKELSKHSQMGYQNLRTVEQKMTVIREEIIMGGHKQSSMKSEAVKSLEEGQTETQSLLRAQRQELNAMMRKGFADQAQALKMVARASDQNMSRLKYKIKGLQDDFDKLERVVTALAEYPKNPEEGGVMKGRVEGLRQQLNKVGDQLAEEMRSSFKRVKLENQQWMTQLQQKNLQVLKELTANIKSIKTEQQKVRKEKKEESQVHKAGLKSLREQLEASQKETSTSLVNIFNHQFDVLVRQIEMLLEITSIGKKDSQKYTDHSCSQLKKDLLQLQQQALQQLDRKLTDKAIEHAREMDITVRNSLTDAHNKDQQRNQLEFESLHRGVRDLDHSLKGVEKEAILRDEDLDRALHRTESGLKQDIHSTSERVEASLRRMRTGIQDEWHKTMQTYQSGLQNRLDIFKKTVDSHQAKLQSDTDTLAHSLKLQLQEHHNEFAVLAQRIANDVVLGERQTRGQQLIQLRNFIDSNHRTTMEMVQQRGQLTKRVMRSQVEEGLHVLEGKLKLKIEDDLDTMTTIVTTETKKVDTRMSELQFEVRKEFRDWSSTNGQEHNKILEAMYEISSEVKATLSAHEVISQVQHENEAEAMIEMQEAFESLR